jgi:hypothetical protein
MRPQAQGTTIDATRFPSRSFRSSSRRPSSGAAASSTLDRTCAQRERCSRGVICCRACAAGSCRLAHCGTRTGLRSANETPAAAGMDGSSQPRLQEKALENNSAASPARASRCRRRQRLSSRNSTRIGDVCRPKTWTASPLPSRASIRSQHLVPAIDGRRPHLILLVRTGMHPWCCSRFAIRSICALPQRAPPIVAAYPLPDLSRRPVGDPSRGGPRAENGK